MSDAPHKNFLEELRSLSEPAKQKLLIIATVAIMVVVVVVWLVYFNSIIIGSSQQATAQTGAANSQPSTTIVIAPSAAAAPQPSGPGLWQTMWQGIKNVFGSISSIFSGSYQYRIQPQ